MPFAGGDRRAHMDVQVPRAHGCAGADAIHEPLNRNWMLAEGCALIRSGSFHRPAAGAALFTAEKDPKRLAPGARRFGVLRSEERRVREECVSTGRSRWWSYA